jgi:carbon monoxide dehydrogenase subunit G
MGEHAEETIVIDAPAAEVMDVITEYESYPDWADVKSATVLQRGEGGLATEVAFEVDVPLLGRASYTLSYRYAPGDAGVSWVTKDARGAVSNIVGEYLLDDLGDGTTRVTYRLDVELGVLLPGFVRTQGARRVMENALERLKARVELG